MSEKAENVLLTICIPTYNRAEILKTTIESYVSDPAFDERVEIVISDNCSSDNTEVIIKDFIKSYFNIFYSRNTENTVDKNFVKALSLGKGQYLKLANDTVTMKQGALKAIIDVLELEKAKMRPVFFYQNISFLNNELSVNCPDLNSFILNVSFWITWIANFGIWKRDFDLMADKERLAGLHFIQTDLTLRQIISSKESLLSFGDYYNIRDVNLKGGYNAFMVFTENYLSVYNEYLYAGLLKYKTYRIEKYRLFRYYLLGLYLNTIMINNSQFNFKKDNAFKILFKNYKWNIYFYLGFCYLAFKKIETKIKYQIPQKSKNK